MDTSRFDRITDLTSNRTNWKIKVRLTRLWKSINTSTDTFKGYNMILLDDDKTHIHAFAGLDFVNGINEVPEEGKVYIISEFNVDDATYSYSAVSNKKEIYFLKRTNMTLIEEDDGMIPEYKFELVAFNALKSRVGDTKILTDLMGLVENILPMQSRNTATGPKDILLFDITDGRLNAINGPITVDHNASVTESLDKTIQTYNLKQITDLRHSDMQNLEVICHVSVTSIDAQSRWWFYSCDACPKELSFIDNNYKCEECGKTVFYPDKRFKVSMYVTDPTDTIQVFMFDREVRRLVSATVNGLIGQNIKEGKGDQLPEKLLNIVGTRLTLTLSLNAKNLVDGNSVYFASDVVKVVATSENASSEHTSEQNTMVPASDLNGHVVDTPTEIKPPPIKRVHNKHDGPNKKNKS
ncbi:uncharacterized protein LOC108204162 [Daucus carota subsp. sativus]|uniref:uncharacterized protein LOC108204162 n=1 Tax=Daucus carota subsp. sativus TaxID=79200 RepID=UPI003083C0F0